MSVDCVWTFGICSFCFHRQEIIYRNNNSQIALMIKVKRSTLSNLSIFVKSFPTCKRESFFTLKKLWKLPPAFRDLKSNENSSTEVPRKVLLLTAIKRKRSFNLLGNVKKENFDLKVTLVVPFLSLLTIKNDYSFYIIFISQWTMNGNGGPDTKHKT